MKTKTRNCLLIVVAVLLVTVLWFNFTETGQPSPAPVVRPGVQPGQLPTSAGPTPVGEALVADDVAGEAAQDRCEGHHARPLRHLPACRGRRAQAAVADYPGTDSTAAPSRDGATMNPATDETAGGRGGDGEGLCGLAMNASARVGLPAIMAQDRPDCPVIQQNWCLWMMESALESAGRPTAVAGHGPSGESRIIPEFQ